MTEIERLRTARDAARDAFDATYEATAYALHTVEQAYCVAADALDAALAAQAKETDR
jgi:hypothetical protein